MAITQRIDGNYIGLNSDTKPTSDVPGGVIFLEYDTRYIFIYDGTEWRRITKALKPEFQLYQHLLNGASRNMNVDGLSASANFKYTVPAGKYVELRRINIIIEDDKVDPADFGGIAGELTNGIEVKAFDSGDSVLIDFCNGFPIKTNIEWGLLVGVDSIVQSGTGDDGLLIRFSLRRGSEATQLNAGEYLQITVNDNLTTITKFHAFLQGKIFEA